MADYKTLNDLDVSGQRVLVRADLNVPMHDGRVTDTLRLDRLAPTLRELADSGARVVVLSHLGRPKGAVVPELSLQPVAAALGDCLGRPVTFADDCVGKAAQAAVDILAEGDIAVLENLRFHAGEESNDPEFAAALAALGDIYVNDAFSAAHRAHASTEALAHLLPSVVGRFMQTELDALAAALTTPARPLVAIVGGAKISTKLDLLGNLSSKVDALIIGGGMANTFLNAQGIENTTKSTARPHRSNGTWTGTIASPCANSVNTAATSLSQISRSSRRCPATTKVLTGRTYCPNDGNSIRRTSLKPRIPARKRIINVKHA